MSLLIPRQNKPKIIALLRELSREVIYPHLPRDQQELVEQYCAWAQSENSGAVTIKAGLATEPTTASAEFKFELIFTPAPIGPGK